MKILFSAIEIEKKLCEHINNFNNISMSVAWASASSKAFKVLISNQNKNKIKYSTVGLHFYQTHPNFIKEFLDDEKVKFYKQKDGIFHPKIYLFWNDESDWICLIGSANFTQSALTKNSEVMTMFDSNDSIYFKNIKDIIDSYYLKSSVMTQEKLKEYIEKSEKSKKETKDDFKFHKMEQNILNMKWDEYYSLLLKKGKHLKERFKLLAKANEYFNQNTFVNMSEEQRKNIAGANKKRDNIKDWRLFGTMPIPRFLGRLATNDSELKHISLSLEYIFLDDKISLKNYNDFLYYFIMADKSFKDIDDRYEKAGWGYGVSPISRLLSVKRPDEFFCLTGANQPNLMKMFGIKKEIIKAKSYERYWDEIIEPVRQSPWYNSDEPTDPKELQAWKGRVALMDALFYFE